MNKFRKLLLAVSVSVLAISSTAFAGEWKTGTEGWYWQEDDGSYPASSWKWLDGNQDGVSECYYFNSQGYLVTNTTTPDGYQVDGEGRWIADGQVQTQGQAAAALSGVEALYAQAQQKTNSLDSMAATADVRMNMSLEGMTVPVTMNMDMKMKNLQSSDIQFIIDMRMNLLGMDQNVNMFYAGGYCYMEAEGEKVKVAMPFDEAMQTAAGTASSVAQEGQYLQDMHLVEDGQGNKTFNFNYSSESMNALLNQVLGQMTDTSGLDSMNLKEYTGSLRVNSEGYITSGTMVMKFDAVISGSPVSYDMVMDITYLNPGQPVDFALPSTEGFIEIS